jgi:hypothetical protein
MNQRLTIPYSRSLSFDRSLWIEPKKENENDYEKENDLR